MHIFVFEILRKGCLYFSISFIMKQLEQIMTTIVVLLLEDKNQYFENAIRTGSRSRDSNIDPLYLVDFPPESVLSNEVFFRGVELRQPPESFGVFPNSAY